MPMFKSLTYAQVGLPSVSPAHLPYWLTFKREDIALDVRYLGIKRFHLFPSLIQPLMSAVCTGGSGETYSRNC